MSSAAPLSPTLLVFLLSFHALNATSALAESDIEAELEAFRDVSVLAVRPCLLSSVTRTVRYQLAGWRTGRAGSAQLHQGGTIALAPGRRTCPAAARWGISPGDRYALTLQVYSEAGEPLLERIRVFTDP